MGWDEIGKNQNATEFRPEIGARKLGGRHWCGNCFLPEDADRVWRPLPVPFRGAWTRVYPPIRRGSRKKTQRFG